MNTVYRRLVARLARHRWVKAARAQITTLRNLARFTRRQLAEAQARKERAEYYAAVNKLTNWQRKRWIGLNPNPKMRRRLDTVLTFQAVKRPNYKEILP